MPDLYKFTTDSQTWRFTDGKRTINYGGADYDPQPVERARWDRSLDDQDIVIMGPADIEPFSLFREFNPSSVLELEIRNSDTGDVELLGKVVKATYDDSGKKKVELRLTTLTNVIQGDLPASRYSPGCNNALFDHECELDRNDWKVSFPAADAVFPTRLQIQHPSIGTLPSGSPDAPGAAADGYYAGGYAENGAERIYILAHTGSVITVITPFIRLLDVTISVFAACDKSRSTCIDKFDNEKNFTGFPFVPTKNPVTHGF